MQRNYSQLKEQENTPEKQINRNNLPVKEFKVLEIKMLTELGKIIDLTTEHFNKELENIKKTQSKINNSVYGIQNTLEGMNSRLSDTE